MLSEGDHSACNSGIGSQALVSKDNDCIGAREIEVKDIEF